MQSVSRVSSYDAGRCCQLKRVHLFIMHMKCTHDFMALSFQPTGQETQLWLHEMTFQCAVDWDLCDAHKINSTKAGGSV
jgi:hypothetical protein